MAQKKCTRCGGCCLASSCFAIPFGEEKYVMTNTVKIHACPHLTFDDNNLACCAIYPEVAQKDGMCTSSHSNYDEHLKQRHLFKPITRVL